MSTRIQTLVLSALFALSAFAGSAHAVTISPTSNLSDSVLSNRSVDGPRYNLSAAPFLWNAKFVNSDVGGYAVFKFKNNTGKLQDVTVAMRTLLKGVRGKFRKGVSATWLGGISMKLKAGQFASISMKKQFAVAEVARLRIRFTNPVAALDSFLRLKIGITSQDSAVFRDTADSKLLPERLDVSEGYSPASIVAPTAVPLPGTWLLMLSALGGVLIASRRWNRITA